MGSQMLLLNWNNHKSNMIAEFQQLFSRSELTDVTLACDGCSLQAHKTVLSAHSAFFHNLFLLHPCNNALVILTDVDSDGLKAIVDFMYQGQIHIPQQKLTQFLNIAEKLKIKGLSSVSQEENHNSVEEPVVYAYSKSQSLEHHTSTSSERQPVRSCLNDCFQTNENEQTELSLNSERAILDSSTTCETLKSESCSNALSVPEHHGSFQTNENEQPELSLNSEQALLDSSTTCETLKNESCSNALSVPEHHGVSVLESNFSPSLHNATTGSNEISQNQFLSIPVQSVLQETLHWSLQNFPTDKCKPAASFQTNPENEVVGSSTGSTLSGTQNSSNSNEMESSTSYLMQLRTPGIEDTTSAFSESQKSDEMESSTSYMMELRTPVIEATTSAFSESQKSDEMESSTLSMMQLKTPVIQATTSAFTELQKSGESSTSIYSFQTGDLQAASDSKAHEKLLFTCSSLQCFVCSKMFINTSELLTHQKTHTEEQPLSCTVHDKHDKKFRQKPDLKLHVMAHFGEKPYSCNICDRKFTRSTGLRDHKRLHTGEKPFACTYCERRFSDRSNCMAHKRLHTDEKFDCTYCEKSFSRRRNFVAHLRANH